MKTTNNVPAAPQARDPFQTFFNRLFGDSLQEFCGAPETNLVPRLNIGETDTTYELAFEMPGFDEKAIQVNMQDHVLTITAERREEEETKEKRWHRVEHRYGQFARSIALPQDAAGEGIEAVYRQGVLTVTVPKAPESRPTRIQVRSN